MTAPVAASKAPKTIITGRISAIDCWPKKNPTRFTTLVRLAADDEFTTPATVEVQSERALGVEGQILPPTECHIGGRYRAYPVTDKHTGEVRTVRTADNTLTVL